MITFIGRFVKGLVVGWIMSLMMFLVKRALAKAMGGLAGGASRGAPTGRPRSDPSHNPYSRQTANQNHHDVVETMWVGMTVDQLQRSFGRPVRRDATAHGDVWVYANLNGQGVQTSVTVQNGKVISWQDHRIEPTQPFTAPSP